MTAYSALCRTDTASHFSLSTTNISPPPLFIWQYDFPPFSLSSSLRHCDPFTSSRLSFFLSLCLISSLSPSLTCHSRPVSLGCNEHCGCNYRPRRVCESMPWSPLIMYADEPANMNEMLPLGGRLKLSWPGFHRNHSVTPVAKCWASRGGEPGGVNKQTNRQPSVESESSCTNIYKCTK